MIWCLSQRGEVLFSSYEEHRPASGGYHQYHHFPNPSADAGDYHQWRVLRGLTTVPQPASSNRIESRVCLTASVTFRESRAMNNLHQRGYLVYQRQKIDHTETRIPTVRASKKLRQLQARGLNGFPVIQPSPPR